MTITTDRETGYSEVEYTDDEARELVIRSIVDDGDLPTNLEAVDDHTDDEILIPTGLVLTSNEIDLLNSYIQNNTADEDEVVAWLLDEVEPLMYKGSCYSCRHYSRDEELCFLHHSQMKYNDYCSKFVKRRK